MELHDVADLAKWIEREVKLKRIPKLYAQLAQVLQQNTNPGQAKQSFAAQRAALVEALSGMEMTALREDQIQFLRDMGVAHLVGEYGVRSVDFVLKDAGLDFVTAFQQIQTNAQALGKAVEKIDQIAAALAGLAFAGREIGQGEAVISLRFRGDASIRNAVDLKDWSEEVHDIARGFAMSVNEPPESVRVVGARNGSIIFELASIYVVVQLIGRATLKVLEVVKEVQQIRLQSEQIRALKLSNHEHSTRIEEARKALDAIADEERASRLVDVTKDLEVHFKLVLNGEQRAVLDKAVKKLVRFVEKGGELEVASIPVKDAENGPLEELRAESARLRKASQELRLLVDEGRKPGKG